MSASTSMEQREWIGQVCHRTANQTWPGSLTSVTACFHCSRFFRPNPSQSRSPAFMDSTPRRRMATRGDCLTCKVVDWNARDPPFRHTPHGVSWHPVPCATGHNRTESASARQSACAALPIAPLVAPCSGVSLYSARRREMLSPVLPWCPLRTAALPSMALQLGCSLCSALVPRRRS